MLVLGTVEGVMLPMLQRFAPPLPPLLLLPLQVAHVVFHVAPSLQFQIPDRPGLGNNRSLPRYMLAKPFVSLAPIDASRKNAVAVTEREQPVQSTSVPEEFLLGIVEQK